MMERDSLHQVSNFFSVKMESPDCYRPPSPMGSAQQNYSTYTNLEAFQPEMSPASYLNIMNNAYYNNFATSEDAYSTYKNLDVLSPRDDGLGSSPSSSNSPPSALTPHQISVITGGNNSHYCEMQESSSPGDSAYSEEVPLSHLPEPHHECIKCGDTYSDSWFPKGAGIWFCKPCQDRNRELELQREAFVVNERKRKKSTNVNKKDNQICTNCNAVRTSLWRRNSASEVVCNACGLYEKLHKKARPPSMRKDTIQKRKRKPRGSGSKKKSSDANTLESVQKSHSPTSNECSYPLPAYNSIHLRNLHPVHEPIVLSTINDGSSYYVSPRTETSSPYHLMMPTSVINTPLDVSSRLASSLLNT